MVRYDSMAGGVIKREGSIKGTWEENNHVKTWRKCLGNSEAETGKDSCKPRNTKSTLTQSSPGTRE